MRARPRHGGPKLAALLLLLPPPTSATSGQEGEEAAARPAYPATRRGDDVDSHHGVDVPDPFAWLEQSGAERDRWARSQSELTESLFTDDALRETLRARMVELNQYARAPVPRVAGGLWFVDGQRPGENVSDIRVASGADGRDGAFPRLLVDPHDHPAAPGETVALGPPLPSPDGRFVLHGASSASVGSCVRVVEVESGSDLPDDAVPIHYWPWRVSWAAEGPAFYYVDGVDVRRHNLGTAVADDPVVFTSVDDPAPHLAVRAAADGTMLFVTAFHPDRDTTKVFARELDAETEPPEWRELVAEPPASYQVVGKRGDRVFVYTTLGAPRGRVVAVDLRRPKADHRIEIVPERAEAVYDDNHPIRPTVGLFGDRIAVLHGREGRLLLRAYDLEGELQHEIEHAELGFDESGLVGHPDAAVVRYDAQSIFDPGTAYEVDLHTGERRAIGRAQVPFDPSGFELTRSSFESHDGTEVPIFLAHRSGLERDGSNAVIVNNWAAMGGVVRPLFLPSFHAWIELGGVLAVPAVRGSGEYGEGWHRAGVGRNKVTAIDDFAAAAEWLAESGYARAERIAMMGASMSGPATAGVLVRHPDAFGAGLVQIPRVDLLARRAWPEEYGDFTDADDFRAMLEWMPYPNVVERDYPAVLVQVGSQDTVAPPFHGYKLVAALQTAQSGADPVLLQVVWGTGHDQGRGVPKRCETLSLQFAFLARALGLEAP